GVVREIRREVAARLHFGEASFVCDLAAQAWMEQAAVERRYQPPSRFPALTRDLNVVVARGTPAARVRAVIERTAGERARSIQLFDVYAGPQLPEDRVSLAFSLQLAAADRTLTDAEVDQLLVR